MRWFGVGGYFSDEIDVTSDDHIVADIKTSIDHEGDHYNDNYDVFSPWINK